MGDEDAGFNYRMYHRRLQMDIGALVYYKYHIFIIDYLFSETQPNDRVGMAFAAVFYSGNRFHPVSCSGAEFSQGSNV